MTLISSRSNTVSPVERWAKLYRSPNPFDEGNWDLFEREEVLWDHVAISDLLYRAIPGSNWYVTSGSLNVALAIGAGRLGLHEIVCKKIASNSESYVWALVYDKRQKPAPTRELPVNPVYEDRVTAALMRDALKSHGGENCPKCRSYALKQLRTSLVCTRCNTLVGGF